MSNRLVDLVQDRLDDFVAELSFTAAAIAPENSTLLEHAGALLNGGKRFRALFCYWGWNAVGSGLGDFDPLADAEEPGDLPVLVQAAAALEMFHAAALVHDDIMDNSDTRRGRPAAHRQFETLHKESGWMGSPLGFGQSAALLLGDLLLGWSDELLDRGLAQLEDRSAAAAARTEFNRMRTEVTLGQYLDILEEKSWRSHPDNELLSRAHRVVVYKSAKYSVEAPLAIGASVGGGRPEQVAALRTFGLPLGIAYQLRDDLLGVFGDPGVTGKPAGDDLREGKRTVLIALARKELPPNAVRLIDELLGDRELDDRQIEILQSAIRDSGAIEQIEGVIEHNVAAARAALHDAPLSSAARRQLLELTHTVTQRTA